MLVQIEKQFAFVPLLFTVTSHAIIFRLGWKSDWSRSRNRYVFNFLIHPFFSCSFCLHLSNKSVFQRILLCDFTWWMTCVMHGSLLTVNWKAYAIVLGLRTTQERVITRSTHSSNYHCVPKIKRLCWSLVGKLHQDGQLWSFLWFGDLQIIQIYLRSRTLNMPDLLLAIHVSRCTM